MKARVRFLGLAPRWLADIYTDIAAIAGIMGEWERGETVIRGMQSRIEEVRLQTRGGQSFESSAKSGEIPLSRRNRGSAEMVQAAGGEFIGEPGKSTTAEAIAAEQPDIIIAAWCGAGDRVPLEKIVEQRSWDEAAGGAQRARVLHPG